ncbi:hypothetical protein [Streptomyces sp. NPDC085540]|uniref:nucleotide-binding domain-containing protein n=1 Tax=Streptomyces sp. NPDC085540 TaxID=3365730 RepID=UPI0037CF6DEA
MEQDQYENFRDKIKQYGSWVTEAYEEEDRALSLTAWQRVFGDAFQKPATSAKGLAAAVPQRLVVPTPEDRAPHEQYIEEFGFAWKGGSSVRIVAEVLPRNGFRHGSLRLLRRVGPRQNLRFTISTDVPEPYDLYWKVRNRGEEATDQGQLRGSIFFDAKRSRTHRESTSWKGRHYVEVYIVKDGQVLATDHHDVVID